MSPRTLLAVVLCAVVAIPALADDTATRSSDPADATAPEEVHVRATRPVASVGGASAVAVETDSLALPAAASTEEVLREIPMLHVRRNSRGEAEISARGSESRQVAVLVDGVPITLAWDARADVSILPATAIQELVFVRGLSSMLHGPNVLGGIVEARVGQSLAQPDASTTQVTMGADDVGTFGTTITTTAPLAPDGGDWLVRGGAGFRTTPGDPLAEDVVDRASGDDLRLNTDADHLDGYLALRYRGHDGRWMSFSGSSFRAERGIAAELGAPDDDARFWRYPHVSRTLAVVSGGTGDRKSPFGGRGDVEASLGVDRGRTEIDSYTSAAYDEIDTFENGEDRALTLRLLADQQLGPRSDLRAALTAADVRHDEIVPEGDFRYRQRLWSAGLESVWRLIESDGVVDGVTLSTGGAWDVAETPEAGGKEPLGRLDEWGARAGLTVLLRDRRTTLNAGVSRRGRFPALRELYSGALNRFAPNPGLAPERIVSLEAGLTTRAGTGEVQVVAFRNLVDDAVVRTRLDDGRFFRVNRDRLRTNGLELIGTYAIGRVDLAGNVVFQDAELTDPTAGVTNEPENLPAAFGELDVRSPLFDGLTGGIGIDYTGRQFAIDATTGEDVELDGEAILGGFLSRRWALPGSFGGGAFAAMETRIAVDNALDTALYDQFGLPQPGRRIRFELRLR